MYADCVEARRRPHRRASRRPGRSRFRSTRCWRRSRRARGSSSSPAPATRPACSIRATRVHALARALPARALVFVDEAYADFTDVHFLDELARSAERRRRPHVRQGLRARRRCASARSSAPPAVIARLRRRCRPTASTSPRRWRSAALGDQRAPGRVSRAGRAPRRRCVYAVCDRLGLALLAERGELRAGAGRRPAPPRSSRRCARAASSCATASTRAGLRRLHPHHDRRRRAHRGSALARAGGGPVRRARDRPQDHRDPDHSSSSGSRAAAATTMRTGIRFLDHMLELFARHGAFDLTLTATRRPRRRPAPHRRGRRHRARRGGARRRSATAAASTAPATS